MSIFTKTVAAAGLAVQIHKFPDLPGVLAGALEVVGFDERRAEALLLLDFHAVENAAVAVEPDEEFMFFRQAAHFLTKKSQG